MTTLGDTIYGGASGTPTKLAGNTSTTMAALTQTGTGSASAAPVWTTTTTAATASTIALRDSSGGLTCAGLTASGVVQAGNLTTSVGYFIGSGYSTTLAYPNFTGGWPSTGYWAIGPNSTATDGVLKIGFASSPGVWSTAESTTLQVYIASTAAVALKVDGGISAAATTASVSPTTGALLMSGCIGQNLAYLNPAGNTSGLSQTAAYTANSTSGSNCYGINIITGWGSGFGNTATVAAANFTTTNSASAGTVAIVTGMMVTATHTGAGTTSNILGIIVGSITKSAGTVNGAYGLYINSVTAGTTNYSIYANAGVAHFGDTTAATTTTNGCATFAGGIGVAGAGYFGAGISAAGTISNANGIVNNVGGTAMSGNLVGSRALSVVYTNSTGRVLVVYVVVSSPSSGQFTLLVGGVQVYYFSLDPGYFSGTILVPPGSTYEAVSGGSSLYSWYEY
jgi:hypothetical protein